MLAIPLFSAYALLQGRTRNAVARRKVEEFLCEPVFRDYIISELAYVLGEDPDEIFDATEGLYEDATGSRLRALGALLKERKEILPLIQKMEAAIAEEKNKTKHDHNEQTQEAKGRERPENAGE
jgi:hypothetical protein